MASHPDFVNYMAEQLREAGIWPLLRRCILRRRL